MKKTLMMLWMAVSLMVSLVGCSSEEMDYGEAILVFMFKNTVAIAKTALFGS